MCRNTVFYAQNTLGNIQLNFGETLEKNKGVIIKIVGETNDKIYALGLRGKDNFYIKTFSSSNLSLISNNEIELPKIDGNDLDFEDLIMVEDQFYILGSYYERKNKESNLVAVGVSANGQLNKNKSHYLAIKPKNTLKGVVIISKTPMRKTSCWQCTCLTLRKKIKSNMKLNCLTKTSTP